MVSESSKSSKWSRQSSSLYPSYPNGSRVILHVGENELTLADRVRVILSSLFVVGSVAWVPAVYIWAWKRYRRLLRELVMLKAKNCDVGNDELRGSHCSNGSNNEKDEKTSNASCQDCSVSHGCEGFSSKLSSSCITAADATTASASLQWFVGMVGIATVLLFFGPHRSPRFGNDVLRFRSWEMFRSWIRYVAMEVIVDQEEQKEHKERKESDLTWECEDEGLANEKAAILAFVPHGIFPFGFGFGFVPELAVRIFGPMRPVVAPATRYVPFLRDFLSWCEAVDASSACIDVALAGSGPGSRSACSIGHSTGPGSCASCRRIGINPGGIDEIFVGYPKRGTNRHTEYCIVRKGFLRMALKHGIPVHPIYCFGATKMFRRLEVPWLERLSHALRTSIVFFYGIFGLPIPYRQKLRYIVGNPILPPSINSTDTAIAVDEMHRLFCTELTRLFNRHKDAYGWSHKSLQILHS